MSNSPSKRTARMTYTRFTLRPLDTVAMASDLRPSTDQSDRLRDDR